MNNPPAFPLDLSERDKDGRWMLSNVQRGMTLRDYFAAKAMQAYASCLNAYEQDEIARQSWIMADAMLKAREE